MLWFWYALVSCFLSSFTNFIDKFLVDQKVKSPMILTVASGFLTGAVGIIIGLLGGFQPISLTHLGLILLAGILIEFYIWPYYLALKEEDASRVVPLFQFISIFVLLMSAIFLGEGITPRQFVGFAAIFFGGFLLSANHLESKLLKPRKSLWYMMISSFLYALILIIFRFVTVSYGFWTTFTYQCMGTGLGAVLLLCVPSIRSAFMKQMRDMRAIAGLVTVNNIIGILVQMTEGYALTLVAAPLVSIVQGTQSVMVLVIGFILSQWFPHIVKEDIRRHVMGYKFLMILIIFVGVYFINT